MLLAEQLIDISQGEKRQEAEKEYIMAQSLIIKQKRDEAAKHAVKAYELLYYDEWSIYAESRLIAKSAARTIGSHVSHTEGE